MTAVSYHGRALEFAADELRADKDVVIAAINPSPDGQIDVDKGLNIQFASDEIRQDRTFMFNAAHLIPKTFRFAPEEFRDDYDFASSVFEGFNNGNLIYCSERLQNDKEFVLKAIDNGQEALRIEFRNVTKKMRSDKEVVMAAVSYNGADLAYASDELKADREVVAAAIKQKKWTGYNREALGLASDELKKDPELISLDKRLREKLESSPHDHIPKAERD